MNIWNCMNVRQAVAIKRARTLSKKMLPHWKKMEKRGCCRRSRLSLSPSESIDGSVGHPASVILLRQPLSDFKPSDDMKEGFLTPLVWQRKRPKDVEALEKGNGASWRFISRIYFPPCIYNSEPQPRQGPITSPRGAAHKHTHTHTGYVCV